MSKPIGVALLSFAHSHQFHWARVFGRDPRAEIIAAWDDDRQRGTNGANVTGTQFASDLDRILSDDRISAVAICSETSLHENLTIAAARAGKHVLCEKPMAPTLEQCRNMIGAIEEAGVIYMQAFPQRHVPSNHEIKRLLETKAIGRTSLIRKRHGHDFALRGLAEDMPWIVDRRQAGEGGFLDEGIHECDVLRWFLGDPVAVTAMIGNSLAEIERFGVDDFGCAIFRFAGGELGVLESGWSWVAGGPTTEIYGDQGTIIQSLTDCASNAVPLDGVGELQLFRVAEGELGWRNVGSRSNFKLVHEAVASAFVDCLESGGPLPVTAYDGMKAVEMMVGAYMSAREGRIIGFGDATL